MITNEVTKETILENLTIESCERLIRHLIDKIKIKANRCVINYGMSSDIIVIEHYLDCINIIRENEKLIKAYPPK